MLTFLKACWQEDKQRRLLWLPVLFGLGIWLYFLLPVEPSKWVTLAVIEALIIAAILCRRRIVLLKILGASAVVVAGFTLVQIKALYLAQSDEVLPDETFYFRGRIAAMDTNYQGKPRFILDGLTDFDGRVYQGRYRVTQRSKKQTGEVGQCVELIGTISKLPKAVVAGGYQFDRKGWFEGLKGSGFAESRFFVVDCGTTGGRDKFEAFVARLRGRIVKRVSKVLPPEEASIASAIIAGVRGGISEKQYTDYRNSGLAHFLSISGLHMSMLAGLMFFLVRFVLACVPQISLRMDTKKIAAVFALGLSLVYLFISGQAVPAQRAFIMTFVVLLGVLTNRRAISMQTIALAAFLVLAAAPEVLVSASFQMSFAAVLGLIAFYEKTAKRIQQFLNVDGFGKWRRGVVLYILGVVVSDLIASVMTLPFSMYHFNMIAIYTTLGNFLAGPIIGLVIMPFVLISLLLMPFGVEVFSLKIVGFGIGVVNKITAWVASLPEAGWQVAALPAGGLALIVIGGLWLMLWQAKWRYWGWIGIVLGFLSVALVQTPDMLIGLEGKVVAFKNEAGLLEISGGRGGKFVKDVWSNKYPSSETKADLKAHPELKLNGSTAVISGKSYDMREEIGLSAWRQKDGAYRVKTIRESIGRRLWNK